MKRMVPVSIASWVQIHEQDPKMTAAFPTAAAALLLLAACATSPADKPDYAAKNRPLEERCARLQKMQGGILPPGTTRADVQAEAKAAADRGELDKACDVL
jgi:hypothetical protein